MMRKAAFILLVAAAIMASAARGGHELPVYPSFYPHEIAIKTIAPAQAADELRKAGIQAFIGEGLSFAGTPVENVAAIESLGAFVLLRVNPSSSLLTAQSSSCDIVKAVVRELGSQQGFILHPYPVTPLHGDYLHHFDLAAAAKARLSADGAALPQPKIKASGSFAQNHPQWSENDWDAEIVEVDAAQSLAAEMFSVNGRLGPPWLKTGWFNAMRLLGETIDPADKRRIASMVRRLEAGDFVGLAERINLERDLVGALTAGCQTTMIGYTLKREYVNVEFSAGIENIGYDAITGLASPMFIRTVKLKDFPWNGWLALGIGDKPVAAWNPVGGMTDGFGQFMGFAVGDPALLPAPYEAGWMLNRISDLPANWSP